MVRPASGDMPTLATVGAALAWGRSRLERVDVRVLLAHVLCCDAAWLIAHDRDPLDAESAARFQALVVRRQRGEPVAYLVGTRPFFGAVFAVTPATLIPRPDTELLVELIVAALGDRAAQVADVGTGSGVVAISVARACPAAQVTATDIDAEALLVAGANARKLGANIACVQGAWLAPLADASLDLIAGNPPYLAEDDPHLEVGDLRFEPRRALVSGSDGLDAIRDIVSSAPRCLRRGGLLMLEHGWTQAAAVRALLREAGFVEVGSARDLAGHERVTQGRWIDAPGRAA